MSLFENYKLDLSFDEMFDRNGFVKEHWKEIANRLEDAGIKKLEQCQYEVDWQLEDNGVTYNIYSDTNGVNRRWNLDLIPFVVTEDEWLEVSKGLQQRAKLLNLVFKDLYTEQNLIKKGIVPAEIIFSNKNFITEVANFKNIDYYTMMFYAADISRGPDGKFWVINDKTQSPSGLGYAIENRHTMNSISSDIYKNIEIKKIAKFIDGFNNLLKNLASKKEGPLIAFLTPGPHNETYFEHSYLSSFLDLTLVQGEDLLVKNKNVWLKSLSGLRKVDLLIRRVDERFCDPLELKSDSKLGVAGLIDSIRNDKVSMLNPIGVGILENLGLNPFMENIAEYFLGEKLLLPQIATWWCGQETERKFVVQNIYNLLIKRIDKPITYLAKNMSNPEISELIQNINLQPYLYVGQEVIDFSTVPSFTSSKQIESRNAVIRAFAYKTNSEYEVMPGGLVRVSSSKDFLMVSNQKGGASKDLWILGKDSNANYILKHKGQADLRLDNLSTKMAENLFWLGRYLARTIIAARMIRFTIKNTINANRYEANINKEESLNILYKALTHLTMTYPGFLDSNKVKPLSELISIMKSKDRVGSLSFTIAMLSNVNINVKSLLTLEAWRTFDKLNKEWFEYQNIKTISASEHIKELDKLLIYLMAYKELIDESIFREQGFILYDIGRKIEVSLLLISKIRSLLTIKLDRILEYDILDSMLNCYESYNSYRAFYKSTIKLDNVLDFLLFNHKYPKSLIHMINELLNDFKDLPKHKKSSSLTNYEQSIFKIYSMLRLANTQRLLEINNNEFIHYQLDSFLASISDLLLETSNELTKTYFAHYNE